MNAANMDLSDVERTDSHPDRRADLQSAEFELKAGKVGLRACVRTTPAGLLAIGGLVSSILLSTAVLVWASVTAAKRPDRASR